MQQLKQRQDFTARSAHTSRTETPRSPTQIKTISTSGNIKLALKSRPDAEGPADAANLPPKTQPKAVPAGPRQDAPPASEHAFGSGGDFGGQPRGAGFLSDERFAKPALAAAALAGLLILGATTFALLPETEVPVEVSQTAAGTATSGPSDNLARLMQVAAVNPSPASAEVAPAADTPALAAAATGAGDDIMSKMTASTLAALRSPAPTAAAQTDTGGRVSQAGGGALYQLVMTAHAQGQSPAYIDQMLNAAYQRGQISVPEGLVRADGRVDTTTILSLFIH